MKLHFVYLTFILIGAGLTPSIFAKAQPGKENMPAHTPKEYAWWNLLHYAIDITPDYNTKTISGTNTIQFRALQAGDMMQIDLIHTMSITAISWNSRPIPFKRKGDAYLITFPKSILKGKTTSISIHFEGRPQEAVKPPWGAGGWIWTTDKKGRPWISLACEANGPSVWLPCKNVLYDEPDSGMLFRITVPDTLVAVANGRLTGKVNHPNGTATYNWVIKNPINGYNIAPYIGKYVSWHRDYPGLKGNLDCDFWVLDYHEVKAKQHLKEVDTLLNCFEAWLGPYPFYEDSYKLVESPMIGMEHQSAIAYGNGFENGYGGKNLSGTAWGLKWDFILIHESGHEWFGNSISAGYGGESWIHEGFTKYLETIYTDYLFGTEAGNDYTIGIWKRILNDEPVIGSGSSDQYNKGCAMLHMIRQVIGDSTFRGLLHGLSKTFYHQTVSTEQILHFINNYTKKDFTKVIAQYLRTTKVPVLEYAFKNNRCQYRWTNCVDGFDMPLKVTLNNQKPVLIFPTIHWKTITPAIAGSDSMVIDRNFYVQSKKLE